MVIATVLVIPPAEALIVTGLFAVTGKLVIEKFAVVFPAATVTLACGCAADGTELVSVTTTPPVGAGPSRTTVFDAIVNPPRICNGYTATPDSLAPAGGGGGGGGGGVPPRLIDLHLT